MQEIFEGFEILGGDFGVQYTDEIWWGKQEIFYKQMTT